MQVISHLKYTQTENRGDSDIILFSDDVGHKRREAQCKYKLQLA